MKKRWNRICGSSPKALSVAGCPLKFFVVTEEEFEQVRADAGYPDFPSSYTPEMRSEEWEKLNSSLDAELGKLFCSQWGTTWQDYSLFDDWNDNQTHCAIVHSEYAQCLEFLETIYAVIQKIPRPNEWVFQVFSQYPDPTDVFPGFGEGEVLIHGKNVYLQDSASGELAKNFLQRKLGRPFSLCETIRRGTIDEIRQALRAGANPNTPDCTGYYPLHYAQTAEVARLLVEAGAEVYAKDKKGKEPLDHLDKFITPELWRYLYDLTYPLHGAASQGDLDAIEHLAKDIDINAADRSENNTPLHAAAQAGKPESIKLLLKLGAVTVAYDPCCGFGGGG